MEEILRFTQDDKYAIWPMGGPTPPLQITPSRLCRTPTPSSVRTPSRLCRTPSLKRGRARGTACGEGVHKRGRVLFRVLAHTHFKHSQDWPPPAVLSFRTLCEESLLSHLLRSLGAALCRDDNALPQGGPTPPLQITPSRLCRICL